MSKTSLLSLCLLALVCGVIWVFTWHLTGMAALLVIGLPLVLAVLSVKYGW